MSSSRKNPSRGGAKSSKDQNSSATSATSEDSPPTCMEDLLNMMNERFDTCANKLKEEIASMVRSNFREMGSKARDIVDSTTQVRMHVLREWCKIMPSCHTSTDYAHEATDKPSDAPSSAPSGKSSGASSNR